MKKRKILLYYNDLVFTPSELFLNKDFGQVPFVLADLYNYDLEYLISTTQINKSFAFYKGRKLFQEKKLFNFLPQKLDFIKNFRIYVFLLLNAGKYKALVIFPFVPPSDFIFLKFFKFFNKNALIYTKLDANIELINKLQTSYEHSGNNICAPLKVFYHYKKILANADLVSYETMEVGQALKSDFLGIEDLDKKLINVFNGISRKFVRELGIRLKTFEEKEKIVLIIGRLGTLQKNTELLFRATINFETDWKFILIGPVDDTFLPTIDRYRRIINNFDEKFIFKGLVLNKFEYFQYLNSSRVLLLTSNWEGFPMVYSEALYFGNFIITTNVSGSNEATDFGRIGLIFKKDSETELREILERISNDNIDLSKYFQSILDYSEERFIWEKILTQDRFKELFKERGT